MLFNILMAKKSVKQQQGTEPAGTPVKIFEEKENTSPFSTEQAQVLQSLVKELFDDAGKLRMRI